MYKHQMTPKEYQEKFDCAPVFSEDSKNRISKKAQVRDNTNYQGRIHSEETRKVLSENAKKRFSNPENNPMFGKNHSEETKAKISKNKMGRPNLSARGKPKPDHVIKASCEANILRKQKIKNGELDYTDKEKDHRAKVQAEKAARDKIKKEKKDKERLEKLIQRKSASLQRMIDTHEGHYTYPNFEEEYETQLSRITITCPSHGDYVQQAHAHIAGQKCPKCASFGASKESKEVLKPLLDLLDELELKYYFDDNEYFVFQDAEDYKVVNSRRFAYDLVIPELNLCVEYNGSAWHPDWEVLTEGEWDKWTLGFKAGGDTAPERIKYDHYKAKYLYDKKGFVTWFISPSNMYQYLHYIEQIIKKEAH
jgi:hypothetical protein